MSEIFIETRGKLIDYRFLVESPSESWWREYRQWTAFESPTIIIETGYKSRNYLYISGIPSKRKDRTQTTIRYTLVVELLRNDRDSDAFIKLVSTWLEEVQKAPGNIPITSEIGDILDNCFPEDLVEQLLTEKQPNGNGKILEDALEKFKKAISKLTLSEIEGEDKSGNIWWGAINNHNSRKTWISLVSKLLSDKNITGKALFLNLAGRDELNYLKEEPPEIQKIGLLIIGDNEEPQQFRDPNFMSPKLGDVSWPLKFAIILIISSALIFGLLKFFFSQGII